MSDDPKLEQSADSAPPEVEAKPDPIEAVKSLINQLQTQIKGDLTNLKAEVNRKIDSRLPAPPAPATKPPLREMIYDDPEGAMREIAQAVKSEVVSEFKAVEANKRLASKLYSDYPELQEAGNPLTVRANEILSTYSEEEQTDPKVLRSAVLEAAAELTLAPKPKRKQVASEQSDDNFQLGGGGRTSRRKSSDQTDPGVLEAAKALGLNVDDPKVVARLKARSERGFNRYQ